MKQTWEGQVEEIEAVVAPLIHTWTRVDSTNYGQAAFAIRSILVF